MTEYRPLYLHYDSPSYNLSGRSRYNSRRTRIDHLSEHLFHKVFSWVTYGSNLLQWRPIYSCHTPADPWLSAADNIIADPSYISPSSRYAGIERDIIVTITFYTVFTKSYLQ